MKVTLISEDSELPGLCLDVLGHSSATNWELSAIRPGETPAPSDLYLWDVVPDMVLPEDLNHVHSHFFLLEYRDVGQFRQKTGGLPVNIVLKPVTRSTLRAFLDPASTTEVVPATHADALRRERDEMLQCLLQSNLKLQVYDQERTGFLARAIHDFRAPLTALRGYCGLLRASKLGPVTSDQDEVLRRMEHCAQRLYRMTSAMFQLSMGGRVQNQPAMQRNDIVDCVNQAMYEVRILIEQKCLTVSTQLTPPPEPLFFERAGIEQVLVNLLDNAVKFTPKFGELEVLGYPYFWQRNFSVGTSEGYLSERRAAAKAQPNSYRIDVRDSGVGVLEHQVESIFEEFTSYNRGNDRSGGGLGLAICKMIMQQHGGEVWTEPVKRGGLFSFVIPYRRSDTRTPATDASATRDRWKSEVKVDTGS